MEIIVEGKGVKSFTPDQVIMNFNFVTNDISYEKVLKLGCKSVETFINKVLINNGFNSNDLKTKSFVIKEETKYNELTRKYENDGFSFNQNATLKFLYDKEKLSKLMKDISKLNNSLKYQVSFGLKDEKECRKNILRDAYLDAFEQANAIAEASGKNLKECVKIDFKPFTESYISDTRLGNETMFARHISNDVSIIGNTFTPEDIEITESLYCLWNTN